MLPRTSLTYSGSSVTSQPRQSCSSGAEQAESFAAPFEDGGSLVAVGMSFGHLSLFEPALVGRDGEGHHQRLQVLRREVAVEESLDPGEEFVAQRQAPLEPVLRRRRAGLF